jgi:3-demethoxyubiquinol 3-hydroxylase
MSKTRNPRKRRRRHPGDLSLDAEIDRFLRVDQAGEFGAVRIYVGQLAVLRAGPVRAAIERMAAQEARHLEVFDRLVAERHARPTLLRPLWHFAGFALGAATAALGERAAMACTVAVEEVIDGHYRRQAERLGPEAPELKRRILEFRADELHHRDTAIAHGAKDTPGYGLLAGGVKAASRLAIWLSERI